jgi:hypothetical protein
MNNQVSDTGEDKSLVYIQSMIHPQKVDEP